MAIFLLVSWPQLLLLLVVIGRAHNLGIARPNFLSVSFCLWDWLTNEIDQVQTQACHSEEFILSRAFQHLSINSPPHSVHREI